MGPPSYMRSFFDRKVVMRYMTVLWYTTVKLSLVGTFQYWLKRQKSDTLSRDILSVSSGGKTVCISKAAVHLIRRSVPSSCPIRIAIFEKMEQKWFRTLGLVAMFTSPSLFDWHTYILNKTVCNTITDTSSTQWAAVRIHLLLTIVPPQKCLLSYCSEI